MSARLMLFQFAGLLLASVLVSCASSEGSTSVSPEDGESLQPASENSNPELLTISTPQQDPLDCGLQVVYTAIGRTPDTYDESGLYVSCANGVDRQQLLSIDHDDSGLPEWSVGRMASAPDGQSVLLSVRDDTAVVWKLFELDIYNQTLITILEEDSPNGDATYSPDGAYIAYLALDDRTASIEILHLARQVVSTIYVSETDYSILSVDWSSAGEYLLFEVVGPLGQTQEKKIYLIDVKCNEAHQCTGDNVREANNILSNPSWSPQSEMVVISSSNEVIRLTNIETNEEFDYQPSSIEPNIHNVSQPTLSSDDTSIAFVAMLNSFEDVFVLDRQEMVLHNLTDDDRDVLYTNPEWLLLP